MLDPYKSQYANENIQFVFIGHDGTIIDSDQAFLTLAKGESIFDVHPFFECLFALGETPESETAFDCVNLTFGEVDYTLDIKAIQKKNGLLLILYDLTEHYFAYQTIAQARNESIIRSELVVLKNLELEERERFKNAFIRNFSHELRNPLTSISSITSILEKTNLNTDQRKMLDYLKVSNSNLKSMLEDILSLSMIAEGRLTLDNKIFSLAQLLQLLEFTFDAKAKEKGLEFVLKSDIRIPEFVEGDRLRLFQVLTNLLDNAIKYTQKGKVVLEVLYNQKRAKRISMRFQVSDTGMGIPTESIPSIFGSFTRLDSAQDEKGTGLGLAIVRGLLHLMQTDIKVESSLGEGSVFYFDMVMNYPLQLSSKPLPRVKNRKKPTVKLPSDRKFKLLLVEDDVSVGMVLFKSLINTKRFYIDSLHDGATVMEQLVNDTYDIVLMDVNLPHVSGDQITRTIRSFPFKNVKDIPIIGITANAYEDDIQSYLDAGMNAVLSKPFEEETLFDAIFNLLK